MLRVGFAYIWPAKEAQLRAWLDELHHRQVEVIETFQRETTSHEQVFIIPGADGPMLVYAMEAEDHEAAREAFRSSQLPIDVQHKKVLGECLREPLSVEPVFECALPNPRPNRRSAG